jgi:hypothetical protein
MMKINRCVIASVCALLLILSQTVPALGSDRQESVQLLLLGSVASPVGSSGDGYNTGFRGLVGAAYTPMGMNFKGRVTVSYSHFDVPDVTGGEDVKSGGLKFLGGQADIIFMPPLESPIQPYIFAGYGIYSLDYGTLDNPLHDTTPDITDDALGGGIGVEIPIEPIELIFETSYFHIFRSGGFETLYFTAGVGYSIFP